MLEQSMLDTLKGHFAGLSKRMVLALQKPNTPEAEKRQELFEFLSQLASTSPSIELREVDMPQILRSDLSFALLVDEVDTGIVFSGIPSGHEFTSLVLAILHGGGTPMKLAQDVQKMIAKIKVPLTFEVYVSLSCHNCPDVVQSVNQFALLNENIRSEMIDGGLFPALIEANNIQGVPAVYVNGELFANGKVDTAVMLEKLMARYPEMLEQTGETEQLPMQDVTVIGGGPAAIAAAIYAARKGLKVTVVADRLGGQVKDTIGIENLVSVIYTTGSELTVNMVQHLKQHEVTIKEFVRVAKMEVADPHVKTLTLSSHEVIQTKTVIVATGANWRELGVPGEKEYIGNGVAYCPHCDGPFFKGRDVAVMGGGNSGVEAALDLAGIVKSVTLFEFMPALRADQILQDQMAKRDNIRVIKNASTQEILGTDGKVSALTYQDRETEQVHQIDLAAVFVQIGLVPNSELLKDIATLTPRGEVVIDDRCQTNVEGVFACGDVTTVPFKQIIISMGEGAKAALSAFEYLIKTS